MHAKIVTVDISCDWHCLEALNEQLIDLLIVELLEDLRSEGEMLSHRTRLVVTAEHDDLARVVQLEAEEEDTDLQGEDASVNIIAKEEQIGAMSRNQTNAIRIKQPVKPMG